MEERKVKIEYFKSLEVQIENVGCIKSLNYKLNLEKSQFYVLAGPNGCGKSTFLAVLGTLVMPSFLKYRYYLTENSEETEIVFSFEWKEKNYKEQGEGLDNPLVFSFPRDRNKRYFKNWTNRRVVRLNDGNLYEENILFEKALGFYEPSIEVLNVRDGRKIGMRRPLLLKEIDEIKKKVKERKEDYIPVDKHFGKAMNYILTGKEEGIFSTYLKRLKGKNLMDSHYILDFEDGREIPEEIFSFGERCVLQMLKFIFRTLNPRSREDIKRILIIDEVEIGLHPKALERFLRFFLEKFEEVKQANKNVFVMFSSHSPVVLNYVPLENVLFMVNHNGNCSIETGENSKKFLAPFITSVNQKVYPIVVEDGMAIRIVNRAISSLRKRGEKLPEVRRIFLTEGKGFPKLFKKALELRQQGEFLPPKEEVKPLVIIDGDIKKKDVEDYLQKHPEEKENTEIMKLPPIEKYVVKERYQILKELLENIHKLDELDRQIEEIIKEENEGEGEKLKKAYRKIREFLAEQSFREEREIEDILIDVYIHHLEKEGQLEILKKYLQT